MSSVVLHFIAECALVLACLVAHELGHIVAARACGVRIKKVGLSRMGVYVRRARTTGWPEVAICLAGPAANLALALAFWHSNQWFGLCNLVVGAVNLLPIAHSDGSHALDAWGSIRVSRS